MKRLFVLFFFCLFCFGVAQAAPSVADVRIELIKQLESDGTISSKAAHDALARYVNPATNATISQLPSESTNATVTMVAEQVTWTKYLSWVNVIKVIAVIMLLVAFHGMLLNIIKGLWHLIAQVPVEIYQLGFLAITATATIAPHILWASPHAFYVALFGAFANLMLLSWIARTHPNLVKSIKKLFNLGIPFGCVISFWLLLYFGGLSFLYQSQIFGFFAAVAFSGMLSFGMTYRPGVLELGFQRHMLPAVVIGHIAVLGLYVVSSLIGVLPVWFDLFKPGVEYYCTIALGVALLCGGSPFCSRNTAVAVYALTMMVMFALSTVGFTMYNFAVISSIIMVCTTLWALEWLAYITFTASWILCLTVLGGLLYFTGTMLQTYGHYLVFVR